MTRKKKEHKENESIVRYQCILSMLVISVVISAIWALIRWGWLEFGLFPKAKTNVTDLLIPFILSGIYLFICSHFIKSIKDSIEKFVWGGAFILSVLLFMSTGNIVESRMNKNAKILSITPDRKDVLEKADYIHVVKMSSADLDKYQYGNYLDFSTSSKKSGARDITFHYYEVYALRSVPNVFIGHEVTETHDYSFAKKKALEKKYREFRKRQTGHLRNLNMNDIYLKRLLPRDNIEGFQHAVGNVPITFRKGNQNEAIIYEIVEKPKDTSFHTSMWLCILLIEAILLAFVFERAFVKKEYDEAVSDKRKFKSYISRIFKHEDVIVMAAMPVIMIAVLLLMYLNGFSDDTSNSDMLVDWGALNRNLVTGHGEWWRLLTFGFLHSDFMHLWGNVLFYAVCAFVLYKHYDGYRITTVFLVSSLVSGLFVLFFSNGITVGASGGAFGLMTFWVVDILYSNHERQVPLFSGNEISYLVGIIILNILLSFGNGVSMSGHLGGLVGGLAMGAYVCYIGTRKEE